MSGFVGSLSPSEPQTFHNWQGRDTTVHIWLACERHDFGYRNYKEQSRFTYHTKHLIDEKLRSDFNGLCNAVGSPGSNECHALAASYFEAVESFGEYFQ